MVRLLFDGHPDVYVPPTNELKFMHYADVRGLALPEEFSSSVAEEAKEEMLECAVLNSLGDKEDHLYREEFDLAGFKKDVRAVKCESMKDVINVFLRSFAKNSSNFTGNIDSVRHVIKGEMQTEYYLELREMFPDLKWICVLRNPYAHYVAVRNSYRSDSIGARGGRVYGRIKGVKLGWRDRYPFVINHLMSMKAEYTLMAKFAALYPDNFKVVLFDDVLRDPQPTIKSMCEFLELSWDESLMVPSLYGKPWAGNSFVSNEDFNGISQGPLTNWKKSITMSEIKLINTHFKWVFDKYGFEPVESDVSVYRPFHYTERIKRYVANRVAFYLK